MKQLWKKWQLIKLLNKPWGYQEYLIVDGQPLRHLFVSDGWLLLSSLSDGKYQERGMQIKL